MSDLDTLLQVSMAGANGLTFAHFFNAARSLDLIHMVTSPVPRPYRAGTFALNLGLKGYKLSASKIPSAVVQALHILVQGME